MERDPVTKEVTHMEDDEREVYRLYREQLANDGLSRDQLPYTYQFDALKDHFNSTTDFDFDHHDFWRLLARVTKVGDTYLEDYFHLRGITLPPKPGSRSEDRFETDDPDVDDQPAPTATPSPPPTPPSGS